MFPCEGFSHVRRIELSTYTCRGCARRSKWGEFPSSEPPHIAPFRKARNLLHFLGQKKKIFIVQWLLGNSRKLSNSKIPQWLRFYCVNWRCVYFIVLHFLFCIQNGVAVVNFVVAFFSSTFFFSQPLYTTNREPSNNSIIEVCSECALNRASRFQSFLNMHRDQPGFHKKHYSVHAHV